MILRYVNLYFFDGKTGVLTKTRKGEKQLSPFGGSNDREYLGILCAKVLLDLFYIFADFMECLPRSGIAAFQFNQNMAPILIPGI